MLQMLFKDLKLSPMRTVLTGLSMFIGIVAIISSVLVGTVGRSYLLGTTEQLYGKNPTFSVTVTSGGFNSANLLLDFLQRLDTNQADLALQLDSTQELSFSTCSSPTVTEEQSRELLRHPIGVEALYVSWGYNRIYRLPILEGTWLQGSTSQPRLEAVVNKAGSSLFPVGQYAYANAKESLTATAIPIVGAINDGSPDPRLYLNIAGIVALAPGLLQAEAGTLLWHENGISTSNKDKGSVIEDLMFDTVGGQVGEITRYDGGQAYEGALSTIQLGFFGTAILLLLVSMLGLINIGLSTLEQRSRELLIRRALGASRFSVAWLVLGSSLLLAVLISVIAIVVSVLLVQCVPLLLPAGSPIEPPGYPYRAALYAVLSAAATALLGSFLPAIKASRLEPALALR